MQLWEIGQVESSQSFALLAPSAGAHRSMQRLCMADCFSQQLPPASSSSFIIIMDQGKGRRLLFLWYLHTFHMIPSHSGPWIWSFEGWHNESNKKVSCSSLRSSSLLFMTADLGSSHSCFLFCFDLKHYADIYFPFFPCIKAFWKSINFVDLEQACYLPP